MEGSPEEEEEAGCCWEASWSQLGILKMNSWGQGVRGRGREPGRGLCEQRPGGDRRACMGWQDWEGWGVAAAAVHWLRVSAGASHPVAFRALCGQAAWQAH